MFAQAPIYNVRTDVNVQTISSTPNVGVLTGANTVVIDPDFKSSMVRITDNGTEGTGGVNSNFMVDCGGSAEINFMSPDDKKFYLCDGGTSIIPFTFNPVTMQATRMYVSSFPSTNGMRITSNSTSGEWSFTQNNVMYDMENGSSTAGTPRLKSYDFTNQSTPPSPVTGFDFSSSSACHDTGDSFSGTIGWTEDPTVSRDDQTFASSVSITGGGQGTGTYIIVWNRTNGCRWYNTQTGKVGGQWGTAGTIGISDRYNIHNARLSKDGNWIKIGFQSCISTCTTNIQNYFWQISGTTVSTCVTSDNCLGHTSLGYTHLINSPTTPNQQSGTIRPLNSISSQTSLWTNGPATHTPWDNHYSWENANSSDNLPVLTSTTTNGIISFVWDDEIDALSTDGSQLTYRFAHTFGTDSSQFFSAANAIGSVSQDGRFFAWSSDWKGNLGSTTGGTTCTIGSNCRADVFMVALPAYVAPTLDAYGGSLSQQCGADTIRPVTATISTWSQSGTTVTVTLVSAPSPNFLVNDAVVISGAATSSGTPGPAINTPLPGGYASGELLNGNVLAALATVSGTTLTYTVSNSATANGTGGTITKGTYYTWKRASDSRWWFCTPLGNAFFANGVFTVTRPVGLDYQGVNNQTLQTGSGGGKYQSGLTTVRALNWGYQVVQRMKAWNFGYFAEYADTNVLPTSVTAGGFGGDNTLPAGSRLPFTWQLSPILYAAYNDSNRAAGPVHNELGLYRLGVFNGYMRGMADYLDPNYASWMNGLLTDTTTGANQAANNPHHEYLLAYIGDESDNMGGWSAGNDSSTSPPGVPPPAQPSFFYTVLGCGTNNSVSCTPSGGNTWGQVYYDTGSGSTDKQDPHWSWMILVSTPLDAGIAAALTPKQNSPRDVVFLDLETIAGGSRTAGCVVTLTLPTAYQDPYYVNELVWIAGAIPADLNGGPFTLTSLTSTTITYTQTGCSGAEPWTSGGVIYGANIRNWQKYDFSQWLQGLTEQQTGVSASRSGSTVTLTFSSNPFMTGDLLTVSGCSNTTFNTSAGSPVSVSTFTNTTVAYTQSGTGTSATGCTVGSGPGYTLATLNSAWGSNYDNFSSDASTLVTDTVGTGDGSTTIFNATLTCGSACSATNAIAPGSLVLTVNGIPIGGDDAVVTRALYNSGDPGAGMIRTSHRQFSVVSGTHTVLTSGAEQLACSGTGCASNIYKVGDVINASGITSSGGLMNCGLCVLTGVASTYVSFTNGSSNDTYTSGGTVASFDTVKQEPTATAGTLTSGTETLTFSSNPFAVSDKVTVTGFRSSGALMNGGPFIVTGANSTQITFTNGSGTETATSNGNVHNNPVGYTTGVIQVKFTFAPPSGQAIKATYYAGKGWTFGNGVLDEDGNCPSKVTGCWIPEYSTTNYAGPYMLTSSTRTITAAFRTDLENYQYHYGKTYLNINKSVAAAAAPGVMWSIGQLGGYGVPARSKVLQAAGQINDFLYIYQLPPNNPTSSGGTGTYITDGQARVDYVAKWAGDKPWINFMLYTAQADSYGLNDPNGYSVSGTLDFGTQVARGTFYQTRVNQFLTTQISSNCSCSFSGTFPFVGQAWWTWVDTYSAATTPRLNNYGLITTRDDPYDGKATSPSLGKDQWGYETGCQGQDAYFGGQTGKNPCEASTYGNFIGYVRDANLYWTNHISRTRATGTVGGTTQ